MTVEQKFCDYLNISIDSEEFKKAQWLGVFSDTNSWHERCNTSTNIYKKLCEEKWTLGAEDKDFIVMQHQFEYVQNGEQKKLNSSLLVFGDDP